MLSVDLFVFSTSLETEVCVEAHSTVMESIEVTRSCMVSIEVTSGWLVSSDVCVLTYIRTFRCTGAYSCYNTVTVV